MKAPDGIRVETLEDEPEAHEAAYRSAARPKRRVVIEREWVDGTAGLDGMLAVLVGGAAAGVLVVGGVTPIALAAFGALAIGGSWRTLGAMRKLMNRTRIVVDATSLSIMHGPIPAPAITPIPLASIARVYPKGGAVVAIVDGAPVRVLDGLSYPQATFIADRLAEALEVTA